MAPLTVNPDRDEHRLRLDRPVEADFLVARVQDEVGIDLVELALGKAAQEPLQAENGGVKIDHSAAA